MPAYPSPRPYLPCFMSLLGAFLLLGAWTLAGKLPWPQQFLIRTINLALWGVVVLALCIRHCRSSAYTQGEKLRFALAVSLFGLSTLSLQPAFFQNMSAQSMSMAGFFLLLFGLLQWQRAHPWLARYHRMVSLHRRLPGVGYVTLFALLFLATTISISWFCYSFLPTYTDSTAQYVHAKFVAAGHLFSIPGHALPEFFPVWLMVHGATWYSQYPPMHQTLLGIMYYLDVPWLLNPLEGMLVLMLVYAIASRVYGESTARLAVLLTLLCQFLLAISAEFMNHMSALLFGTALLYSYLRMLDDIEKKNQHDASLWALAAGLSSGATFLTRPLTAIGVSLPFILHALYGLYRSRANYLRPGLMMAGVGLFCVLLQLIYNYNTTGEWLTYAYTRYHSNSFSKAMGYYTGASIFTTLDKMHSDWRLLNVMLFEWSLPCSFFFMLACLLPMRDRATRLIFGVVLSHTLVNMFNQFHSTVFGPRYLFEANSAMIILTAVGIMRAPLLLRTAGISLPRGEAGKGLLAVLVSMVIATGIINRVPNNIRIYSRYMDSHQPFYRSMLEQSEKPALIFLGRNEKDDPTGKFRWVAWSNPPTDDAPVIFAYDRGDTRNRKLIDYYPGRHAYLETGGKLQPAAPPVNTPPIVTTPEKRP